MNYIKGIFINELPNRFRAEILIDGKREICYVGSSCKLNNLINIRNHEVILQNIEKKNSNLAYSLIAAKFDNKYIILNSLYANKAYENYLKTQNCNSDSNIILKEYTESGYKSDFYLTNTKTIIEIKSIITEKKEELFPQINSQRFKRQINNIPRLIEEGYNFRLVIISLNPGLRKVILKEELLSLQSLLIKNFEIEAYTCTLRNNKPILKNKLSIEWEH